MKDVEVLIVEIKQFLGEGQKAMVPRVIGTGIIGTSPKGSLTQRKFMDKCMPEFRPFFQKVIKQADEKGFSINYALTGFSVRKYLPFSDKYASIIYCSPNGIFQFYFGYLSIPEKLAENLRQELMATGIFKETGKKTLTSTLNIEMLDKADEVLKLILDRMIEIAENFNENHINQS